MKIHIFKKGSHKKSNTNTVNFNKTIFIILYTYCIIILKLFQTMAEEVDIDWSDYVNSVHDSVCAVFFHSERIYEITITHCCRDSRTAVSTFKNLFP